MYVYASNIRLLRDSPAHIDFHIKSGDYFAFLATMMGVLEEALGKCESELLSDRERTLARELRHDLRYVQANYEITERELSDVRIIRGAGDLLRRD